MRKSMLALALVVVLGIIMFPMEAKSQMGPGMMGRGYGMGPGMMGRGYGQQQQGDWNYCPYCGTPQGPGPGYGMGQGMMGPGYGRGPGMMGPGMMGPGYGMGPGMMGPGYGYGPQYQQPQKPLEEKDAKEILETYLKSTRNPNLKLGTIEDKGSVFEAKILTKDGSLADKIAVDKYTGWIRSIY